MLASAPSNLKMISAAGLLAKRETYPERPQRIELVETPYSWVYFADRHVVGPVIATHSKELSHADFFHSADPSSD